MSYILGALRKAERERKQDSGSDAADWDSAEWNALEPKRGQARAIKVAFALIILLLVAILVLVGRLLTGEPNKLSRDGMQIQMDSAMSPVDTMTDDSALVLEENGFRHPDTERVHEAGKSAEPANAREFSSESNNRVDLPEITGHLYFSDNAALSRIFVDGGSYRVGHVFPDGLSLTSVSDDTAVFHWRGQQYEVPLR